MSILLTTISMGVYVNRALAYYKWVSRRALLPALRTRTCSRHRKREPSREVSQANLALVGRITFVQLEVWFGVHGRNWKSAHGVITIAHTGATRRHHT